MATPSTCNCDPGAAAALAARSRSLLAKGAFREVSAEHVGVHMEHGLARGCSGVEHQAELAVGANSSAS